MRLTFLLSFLFIFFLFNACNIDKYISSNLNYKKNPSDSSLVEGTILRSDNGQPVRWGYVRIGYELTITDSTGGYSLRVPITSDDNRGAVSPVVVTAYNFVTFIGNIYLSPVDINYDISMVYAAPIFESAYYSVDLKGTDVYAYQFFAYVRDYQGADDVVTVVVKAFNEDTKKFIMIPLNHINNQNQLVSFWESYVYIGNLYLARSGVSFTFIGVDKGGHVGKLER